MALDDPRASRRPRRSAELALSAALDDGQLDRASVAFQNLTRLGLDSWWMRNVSDYLEWCGYPSSGLTPRPGGSTQFEQLVRGTRVALVGPSPAVEDQGDEIESHDLIARISVRSSSDVPPDGWCGRRTNISYWNMAKTAAVVPRKPQIGDGSPDWIVLKGTAPPEGATGMRSAVAPRGLSWAGDQLMIPLAVFDLIVAGAAVVKVYNTTFYASDQAYDTNYWRVDGSAGAEWKIRQLRGFARHDLLDGIHFMKALWRAGKVELDRATQAVIGLEDERFARSIDRLFPSSLLKE
jgi:hypothetical protein